LLSAEAVGGGIGRFLLYVRDGKVHLMSVNEAHPPQAFALEEIDKIHPIVAIVKKLLWMK